MIRVLAIALLFGCYPPADFPDTEWPADMTPHRVIMLAGQSNANGSGYPGYLSPPYSEAFTPVRFARQGGCRSSYPIACNTQWEEWGDLAPRENSFGPEIMVGHNLHAAGLQPLYILQTATGGTDLWRSWDPEETTYRQLYRRMGEYFDTMVVPLGDYTVDAFVWVQGERDAIEDEWSAVYEPNLRAFFARVRMDYGHNLPIVFVKLHADADPETYLYRERIRAAQEVVAAEDARNVLINCDDLTMASDYAHYSSAGYVAMGERIAAAITREIPQLGTTTFETMRATQITVTEAITPTSLASTPFRANRAEMDFREWAEEHPSAAFRRFAVQDLIDYEPPSVSNTDVEEIVGREEVLVAYPNDRRYGLDGERDMYDVMREDMHAIDNEIGHRGTGNYTDGHAVRESFDHEEGENVTILAIVYTFRFYRSV